MLRNPYIDIWAHPGRLANERFKLTKGEITDIVECCIKNDVLVERNCKYDVLENQLMQIVNTKWKYTIGSDAHRISDLTSKDGIHKSSRLP